MDIMYIKCHTKICFVHARTFIFTLKIGIKTAIVKEEVINIMILPMPEV